MKYCKQVWKRQADDTDIEDSHLSRPAFKLKKEPEEFQNLKDS